MTIIYAPTCKTEKIIVVGASRGESVDITCEVEADPPAKSYRWKFNNSGETLDVAAERFSGTSNGTVSILRYTPVSELDYGSLSCWAKNVVGHQLSPCIFQVVAAGKPYGVRNCSLTNQTTNSVEVFCLPGFDGGLPQYFVLELYSGNSIIPRYNVTSYVEPYFFLDNLEPDITFRIVVYSVNGKGRSQGVILEEVTFSDAEKHIANDGDIQFSPTLGILIGAIMTIVIVVLIVIIRARRSSSGHRNVTLEHKVITCTVTQHNTLSSTKPLLRSSSPREGDEKDPDVIPAKFGSPDGESLKRVPPNGANLPSTLRHMPPSASYEIDSGVPPAQWVSPMSQQASALDENFHQYTNPVKGVGTFPRDSRPKDLRLGNGNTSSTLQRASDVEFNGFAIKERLMANRLPESCV